MADTEEVTLLKAQVKTLGEQVARLVRTAAWRDGHIAAYRETLAAIPRIGLLKASLAESKASRDKWKRRARILAKRSGVDSWTEIDSFDPRAKQGGENGKERDK